MNFLFFRKNTGLHSSDIPRTTRLEMQAEIYPPMSRQFPAWNIKEIIKRFGPQIHGLIDNVALPKEEIDRLLMPPIEALIRMVHLLPASESQHHSGRGGLLLHSLESARIAVQLSEQKVFNPEASCDERYSRSNRWAIAAAILLLIHDIGKVLDLRVVDANGCLWDPNLSALHDWLETSNAKSYFVDWKFNRVHKFHEHRALRFAYRKVLTDDLISYLCANGNSRTLDAIEDALILKEGVLADILKESDSQSVAHDLALRKHLPSESTYLSSPLVTPLVAAIQENIQSGMWRVNQEDACVFVTDKGTFIRISTQVGKEIRETAMLHGNQGIPATTDAQFQILAQSGLVETTDKGDVAVFSFTLFKNEFNCVRFLMPERLFRQGIPEKISVTFSNETRNTPSETKALDSASGIPLELSSEEATDYTALLKKNLSPLSQKDERYPSRTSDKENLSPVTVKEISEVLDTPLEKEAAKLFAHRLFIDAFNQLRLGHGTLIANREERDSSLVCSSLPIEKIATNHGLSATTLEALFKALELPNHLSFDADHHLLSTKL